MKKLIVGIFILCCVGFVYADVDTFDGQTGIDTWDGQTGIDTVDGQGVASGASYTTEQYGDGYQITRLPDGAFIVTTSNSVASNDTWELKTD